MSGLSKRGRGSTNYVNYRKQILEAFSEAFTYANAVAAKSASQERDTLVNASRDMRKILDNEKPKKIKDAKKIIDSKWGIMGNSFSIQLAWALTWHLLDNPKKLTAPKLEDKEFISSALEEWVETRIPIFKETSRTQAEYTLRWFVNTLEHLPKPNSANKLVNRPVQTGNRPWSTKPYKNYHRSYNDKLFTNKWF